MNARSLIDAGQILGRTELPARPHQFGVLEHFCQLLVNRLFKIVSFEGEAKYNFSYEWFTRITARSL